MRSITIGAPSIEICGDKARLKARIVSDDFCKELYYEVEEKYGEYLCSDLSDPFVLSLFYYALVNGINIKCTAPITESLYYQLTTMYIPTLVKCDPSLFNRIIIQSECTQGIVETQGGVGASVSCGVDSFYSILRNLDAGFKQIDITHLIVTNRNNIYYGEEDTRTHFEELCKEGEIVANELGLGFIGVYTNEHLFWYKHYQDLHCSSYCALPYALRKLFSIYHYSSGYQYKNFDLAPSYNKDASHYDLLSVQMFSTPGMTIYSSGGEVSRSEKACYIADNKTVQRHLQVCTLQHSNCGVCDKCLRTQLNLYSCRKLDSFNQVFDLDIFEENKDKALIRCIARRSDYDKEILEMMRYNGIPISSRVLVYGNILWIIKKIKKQLKKNKYIRQAVKTYKERHEKGVNELFLIRDKYNLDRSFAKTCDHEIV